MIDWECARKLNPTYEIINAGLDWSGITSCFNKDIFIKIMRAYSTSGGHLNKNILQTAFNAVLGNWINWMVQYRTCLYKTGVRTESIGHRTSESGVKNNYPFKKDHARFNDQYY